MPLQATDCLTNTEYNRLDGITKKYVDCQLSYIDVQIQDIYNQINGLNPPNYDDVLEILNYIVQQNEICCKYTTNELSYIHNTLDSHTRVLQELLKCCKYKPIGPVRPIKPLIPGQAITELCISTTPPKPYKPSLPLPDGPLYETVKPVRDERHSRLILWPAERGYFSIIGIAGSWRVEDKRIVNQVGDDLEKYLPICFHEVVCENKTYSKSVNSISSLSSINDNRYNDCIELVAIRGYVVKFTSQNPETPLLIYETRKGGTTRTFEASTSLWNKYAQRI